MAIAQNPVGWFEIYVQDMERATTFYRSVLQAELQKLNSPGIANVDVSDESRQRRRVWRW